MPFTVLRIQKLKTWGAVAGAGKHNQRERETPNANADKASANQHLVGVPVTIPHLFEEIALKSKMEQGEPYSIFSITCCIH